jgi:hypothetical protein
MYTQNSHTALCVYARRRQRRKYARTNRRKHPPIHQLGVKRRVENEIHGRTLQRHPDRQRIIPDLLGLIPLRVGRHTQRQRHGYGDVADVLVVARHLDAGDLAASTRPLHFRLAAVAGLAGCKGDGEVGLGKGDGGPVAEAGELFHDGFNPGLEDGELLGYSIHSYCR